MVRALPYRVTHALQGPALGVLVLGTVVLSGGSLLASPHGKIHPFQPWQTLAEQRTLVMTCTGDIEASDVDFTVVYSSEEGFSEITLSRGGAAIAAADLSFSGRNDNDQKVWRGTTTGKANIVLIHLSDQAVQPGDSVSISHDGQWGRGQCAGSYWYSNGA